MDGVLNHFAQRWWVTKAFSMFKMGYEIFSNCVKLSSALESKMKNDGSFIMSNCMHIYFSVLLVSHFTLFLPMSLLRD